MLYLLMYFCIAFALLAGILFVLSLGYQTKEEKKKNILNRRERFRLGTYKVKCDYVYEPTKTRAYGSVIDISSTGIKLHTFQELPADQTGVVSMSFTLGEKDFSLKGVIVRKKKHNDYRYEYGIQFQHPSEKEHEALFKTIWNESKKKIAI